MTLKINDIKTEFPLNVGFRGFVLNRTFPQTNPDRANLYSDSFKTNMGELTILRKLILRIQRGGIFSDSDSLEFRIVAGNQVLGNFNSQNLVESRTSADYANRKYKLDLGKFKLPAESTVTIYSKLNAGDFAPCTVQYFISANTLRTNEGSF